MAVSGGVGFWLLAVGCVAMAMAVDVAVAIIASCIYIMAVAVAVAVDACYLPLATGPICVCACACACGLYDYGFYIAIVMFVFKKTKNIVTPKLAAVSTQPSGVSSTPRAMHTNPKPTTRRAAKCGVSCAVVLWRWVAVHHAAPTQPPQTQARHLPPCGRLCVRVSLGWHT